MSEQYRGQERTGFYSFARVLAWLLAHSVYPVKIVHRERLDAMRAPYILISNHDTALDPVALAYAVRKYEIRFLAKKELMRSKFASYLLGKRLHAIPVDRHASDMTAMRLVLNTIKDGHVVGVFPEGTRHKRGLMNELERGVAILMLRSGVPLAPVYIHPRLRPFHVTRLTVGLPLVASDFARDGVNKAACDRLLCRIEETYAALEKEYAK